MTKKRVLFIVIILILFLAGESNPIHAAGLTLTTGGSSQVIHTESQAVIVFDGKKETLLESFTFNLNPVIVETFIYLTAVPTQPEVELIKDINLFTNLDKLTQKKITKDNLWNKLLFFDIEEEKSLPSQVFTRPIDITRYDIFSPPDQIAKLNNWLDTRGYLVPKQAKTILENYENQGWHFIAAEVNALHIELDATESLTTPGAHTFPIKITFPTDKIIYPLKLAGVAPDLDTASIPLNFAYGTKSDDVLGVKDEKVDDLLSYQSKNEFPRVPTDYAYFKTELYVFDKTGTTANNFTIVYANWVNSHDIKFMDALGRVYFKLPNKKMYLTRLFSYKPFLQLEDMEITQAPNNQRVNPNISVREKIGRGILLLVTLSLMCYPICKRIVNIRINRKIRLY